MIGFNKHKVIEKVSHPNPSTGIQEKTIETRKSSGNSAHFFGGAKIHNCTTSGLAAASCQVDNAGSKSPQGDFPPVKFNCKSPRIFVATPKRVQDFSPQTTENHPKNKQTTESKRVLHLIVISLGFSTTSLHLFLLATRKLFLAT